MSTVPHQILTYAHRRDGDYLRELQARLSVAGEKGLMARALPLDQPKEVNGKQYHRMCEISFLGLSANNLFDRARAFIRDGGEIMVDTMEELFRRHQEFEDNNIWLAVRFLFVYPYSTYAMSIINAETTERRCAIDGDSVHPAKQQEFQVDEDRFKAASLFKSQKNTLNLIQEWIEKYNWVPRDGHSIAVRFTPLSPNLCGLIINDTAFCDSYILAKKHRYDDRLLFSCPLVQINKAAYPEAFAGLENHFRYLWQMNITLDCSGATEFQRDVQDSLGKIKPPAKVSFESRARRLVERHHLAKGQERQWVMKTKRQFYRYITMPEESIKFERIFISCSWDDNEYGESMPNGLALKIKKWILNDLNRDEPNLEPIIVQGAPGERFSDNLFHLLETSTLGVILLTDDMQIRDEAGQILERLSRHNVYHELGYLMRSVESEKKIFIGLEQGVKLASNLTNNIYRSIKSKAKIKEARKTENFDISLVQACYLYIDVLDWLRKESSLLRTESLCYAISQHELRIKESFGVLTPSDQKETLDKLRVLKEEYCNNKPASMP